MSLQVSLKNSIVTSSISVIILLVLYALTATGMMGDNPVGQSSSYDEPLVVPAGYAFSIWSIIYLGIISFPVYAMLYRRHGLQEWKSVHFWFSINVICNGLWLVFASYDYLLMTVAIIAIMLYSLVRIYFLLRSLVSQGEKLNFWTEKAVFSIYFAWITLATALNIAAALTFYDWQGWGLSAYNWSLIILPVTAIIAGTVFAKFHDRFYAGVVVWAFVALVIKHLDSIPSLAYLSGFIALLFIALIIFRPGHTAESK